MAHLLDNILTALSCTNCGTKTMEMEKILVDSLMSKKVVCTHPQAEVTEIARTMRERSYSCLVVTEKNLPVGVITERDMVTASTVSCLPDRPSASSGACKAANDVPA